jgi:hypothetical protein
MACAPGWIALDAGDCRFAACGTLRVRHFAQRGFEFFLLSNFRREKVRGTDGLAGLGRVRASSTACLKMERYGYAPPNSHTLRSA